MFIAVIAFYSDGWALLAFGMCCIPASVTLPWLAVMSFVSSTTGVLST